MRKFLIILAGFLLICFGLWRLSVSRTYQLFGELVSRVETNEKIVALTFDDGPKPDYTEKILDILKKEGVKATFFLVGREIRKHSEQAKEIVAHGHELGNHSFTHHRMIILGYGQVVREISDTSDAIREVGYSGPILFRPPYGKKLLVLPYYLEKIGMPSITWDLQPESYPEIANDAGRISRYVVSEARPGSIVLLHVMNKSRTASIDAVEGIIDGLRKRGYSFVTVSELLKLRGG